ncbi:hypothetical protein [Bacterioplanoides sp. SCSIO 12839]|uniref:hypothetical protein n=1 Tax=Bacterioplanoides sp. SCSIO 12839 TaxID=2829569 RepID=UPI002104D1C7|nr:hypothetical protein [Bacterioplanoides sp. SCSIO 12839]UTW49177.1 hypothetical protein KFF03_04535 [Bacterioplanoides sp. SCSIO 12839]
MLRNTFALMLVLMLTACGAESDSGPDSGADTGSGEGDSNQDGLQQADFTSSPNYFQLSLTRNQTASSGFKVNRRGSASQSTNAYDQSGTSFKTNIEIITVDPDNNLVSGSSYVSLSKCCKDPADRKESDIGVVTRLSVEVKLDKDNSPEVLGNGTVLNQDNASFYLSFSQIEGEYRRLHYIDDRHYESLPESFSQPVLIDERWYDSPEELFNFVIYNKEYSTSSSFDQGGLELLDIELKVNGAIQSESSSREDEAEIALDASFMINGERYELSSLTRYTDGHEKYYSNILGSGYTEVAQVKVDANGATVIQNSDNYDSGSGSDGNSDSIDCDSAWSGPNDIQASSFCSAACLYAGQNNQQGVSLSCQQLDSAFGLRSSCSVCN